MSARTWIGGLALVGLLAGALSAGAGGPPRCWSRWDEGLQRWETECTDGSRAVSRWDEGLKAWRTDVVKPPSAPKAERGTR
jgi:hypothetical protein